SHRGLNRRDRLLQSDPKRKRREQRKGHRPNDGRGVALRAGLRRGGAAHGPARRRARHRLHPDSPAARRSKRWRPGPPPDREDVQGREELLPPGRGHRLFALAFDSPQQRRASEGLRARRVQRAFPGPDRLRWAHSDQFHERGSRRSAVGASREESFEMKAVLFAALAGVAAAAGAQEEGRLDERAHQDRDIVYFLQQPETHSFDLYHDYTESRPGTDKYLNVVRKGSRASKPSARILDTGETLTAETLRGDSITRAGLDIGEPVQPGSEVVVIRFAPVEKGKSVRLRISETYTDEKSYRLDGDELIFDRSFGRPRNAVVL